MFVNALKNMLSLNKMRLKDMDHYMFVCLCVCVCACEFEKVQERGQSEMEKKIYLRNKVKLQFR